MSEPLSLAEYLAGFIALDIDEGAIRSIAYKRGVEYPCEDVSLLTEKEIDLCLADLYMYCATFPSVRNNVEDSDGGWKHTEGGWQISVNDKKNYRAMAKRLYEKWGETLPKSSIVIINL